VAADRVRGQLRSERGPCAPRLHLDEDQDAAVERDQVQLAGGEADVAADDLPA